jgi:predicted dehydrogenase
MPAVERKLRVGVLGCGPIAQFAHFEACRKARNAELYAICDQAEELVARMAAVHGPCLTYRDYEAMLADAQVDAVLVATTDAFHVPLASRALEAGKHVLVEKPLGVSVEECEALRARVEASRLTLQVGHNMRFDPAVVLAHRFAREEMGEPIALAAWYHDSTERYTMTDGLQPIPVRSAAARRPPDDPRADRRRYLLTTHGCHLIDLVQHLAGRFVAVRARYLDRAGCHCWHVDVELASGALGHLEVAVPVQGDYAVGIRMHGAGGSIEGKLHLAWYRKSGELAVYAAREGLYRRALGADAFTYKLQVEAFAETVLRGAPQVGATVADGASVVRAMVAIARSAESGEWVRLDAVRGAV